MGCDIHMFIEYRCGNGMPWLADDHHKPDWEDPSCRMDNEVHRDNWCDDCKKADKNPTVQQLQCDRGYFNVPSVHATGRDYQLFGLLASVREEGPREPLGLPDDMSENVAMAAERWDSDGHSHSYISLEEFENVLFKEAEDYVPTGRDEAFYDYSLYSRENYKDCPPDFTPIINYCKKLKEEKSIDKVLLGNDTTTEVQVRLVFWFDN
jgi:hypothetical protein